MLLTLMRIAYNLICPAHYASFMWVGFVSNLVEELNRISNLALGVRPTQVNDSYSDQLNEIYSVTLKETFRPWSKSCPHPVRGDEL